MTWKTYTGAAIVAVAGVLFFLEGADVCNGCGNIAEGVLAIGGALGLTGLRHALSKMQNGTKIALLLLGSLWYGATTAVAQDSPAFAIEAGVTSPRDPTATFGLIVGDGATRSYSRFAFDADGKARQVETGIERLVHHSRRFDIIVRGRVGVAQDENNTSGTLGGSFGFSIPIRWGLSLTVLGDGDNAPIHGGEWRGAPFFALRWVAQ